MIYNWFFTNESFTELILQEWDPRQKYRVSTSQCFLWDAARIQKKRNSLCLTDVVGDISALPLDVDDFTYLFGAILAPNINQIRMCRGYFLWWWCKRSSSNLLFWLPQISLGTFWVSQLFSPLHLFCVFHVADLLINKPAQDLQGDQKWIRCTHQQI